MAKSQKNEFDFQRIALLSLPIALAVFVLRNIIEFTFFVFGRSWDLYLTFYNVAFLLLGYYVSAMIFFAVFTYIRSSLPKNYKKAGLVFGLIIFLIGKAPESIFVYTRNMLADSSSGSTILSGLISPVLIDPFVYLFVDVIPGFIIIFCQGLIIAYAFEKYYKKLKKAKTNF
jgi:hypothetical protein